MATPFHHRLYLLISDNLFCHHCQLHQVFSSFLQPEEHQLSELDKKIRSYCPHFADAFARKKSLEYNRDEAWTKSFMTISEHDSADDDEDEITIPCIGDDSENRTEGSFEAAENHHHEDQTSNSKRKESTNTQHCSAWHQLVQDQPREDDYLQTRSTDDENQHKPSAKDLNELTDNGPDSMEVQLEKLKVLFLKIDTDGDGKICQKDFYEFIKNLDINLPRNETDLIFQTIDKDCDNYISFREFEAYFVEFVIGESPSTVSEAKLRAAFITADRDGKGRINFHAFIEHAFKRRRTMSIKAISDTFEALDKDKSGDICFREFRDFFNRQSRSRSLMPLAEVEISVSPLEEALKEVSRETDTTEMVSYLWDRWKKFKTFKREGESGEMVMTGAHGIVNDHLPGEYALLELACFNDLPPIVPKHTVITDIQWLKSPDPSTSGRILFPPDFNRKIATDLATSETLAFYGCSLADGNQLKVSLLYRHGIQDFTYENSYLDDFVIAGSRAGIERHAFVHLDCPLDNDSGRFVLAKIEVCNRILHTYLHIFSGLNCSVCLVAVIIPT